MDPEEWDHPEEFRPERFLNEDESAVHKPDNFMPFGIGQRMCLGDQLAEKEFFLFFTSLLHCFQFQNPSGRDLPSLRGVAAVTVTPQDYQVTCSPRNVAALEKGSNSTNNSWLSSRTYG